MMHEVSAGRFSLGIGIAHGPSYVRMGVTPGKPLADTRAFIEKFRAETSFGPLPPIIVAALRKKMVALAGELAEGVVFANVCRSHMHESLSGLPAAKRKAGFFIGNMIPTCISDDEAAAKVREGVAAWRAAGVHTPILVPSSAAGNQLKAIDEVFSAFSR